MAKVKYYLKENTKVGTHSFYAIPQPNGTLDFDEVCEETAEMRKRLVPLSQGEGKTHIDISELELLDENSVFEPLQPVK